MSFIPFNLCFNGHIFATSRSTKNKLLNHLRFCKMLELILGSLWITGRILFYLLFRGLDCTLPGTSEFD